MAAVDYMMEELGTKSVILENLDMEDFLKERDMKCFVCIFAFV